MLKEIIAMERTLRYHLNTPVGPYLEGYLCDLAKQGFATITIHGELPKVTAFGQYLVQHNISLSEVTDSDRERFVHWYHSSPRHYGTKRKRELSRRKHLNATIRKLFGYLRNIGVILPSPKIRIPHEDILNEYLSFLRIHRGLVDSGIKRHRCWAISFFQSLEKKQPPVTLSELTGTHVEDFVMEESKSLGADQRLRVRSTIKSLVEYLRSEKKIPSSCIPYLPKRRSYAMATIPWTISWSDIERVVSKTDRTTAVGRRNYALLMLLKTYGLRSGEVVGLRIEDINWRQEVIHIRQNKTKRSLELPLVTEVADALIDYLRHGRPQTTYREIFIKCFAPYKPISNACLYYLVRMAFVRAGIKAEHSGPCSIRHALATSLLRQGRSLKEIGDLFGHRKPETTMIYCKLGVEDLRKVALELPEVSS